MILNEELPLINGWQKELPDQDGDWIWIYIFSCGCCTENIGVVYIRTSDPYDDEADYNYTDRNGVKRSMYFEANKPLIKDDKIYVNAWTPLKSPYGPDHY